ncbi:gliding motility protein RemB [Formosa sp. PL04]|uniref:gliding motility protein RemB n=1 Tax=Formosa sp. PL04 TaxID=3081755 RepID=UPI0029823B26|nr:gliding motility protein RemB [Formosa sp. PL04]MDW5287331.1 gliding motility protein RemB [Formosa sp. PL04]
MKRLIVMLLLIIPLLQFAQQSQLDSDFYEKPPVFKQCDSTAFKDLQACFDKTVYNFVYDAFKMPEEVVSDHYTGNLVVLFEVDKAGHFKVLYTDAVYNSLQEEARRIFSLLPNIKPATYNGNPIFKQYSVTIGIPLTPYPEQTQVATPVAAVNPIDSRVKNELDSINKSVKFNTKKQFKSTLNIPLSHSYYAKFDRNINLVGTNSHTASKPLLYADVDNYYDFEAEQEKTKKDVSTWLGRKFWNEHLAEVEGENYWFLLDPVFDLQVGKDTEADFNYTYNNTRGIVFQGGFGKHFTFYTSFYESQGRFAQYYNTYAESLNPAGSDPAIVPGRGIAKAYNDDAFDYPVAEAYMSYSPAEFLNLQFGQGKNFIGDGYRSLLVSDVSVPTPFLKVNVSFWKLKYTSTWSWFKDVRPEVTVDKTYFTKYMSSHYLSLNVSKRLNIGLFESVIWADTNDRGFDVSYLNPIIFLRAVEFQTGQGAGNAILGFTSKYKLNDNMNFYGQFIIDEFSTGHVSAGDQSWKNKFGYQLGYKYYNAFKVDNLMLQAEYNQVRPYTYSHNTIILNYGNYNQPIAHLWGANFREFILIGRYNYKRWFADGKLIFGVRGIDYDTAEDSYSYGGDIYRDYNDRPYDSGVKIGQGIKTKTVNAEVQAGYLINPATNLKLFTNISYRNFNPDATTATTYNSSTVWFTVGLRSDLFNWYFDL